MLRVVKRKRVVNQGNGTKRVKSTGNITIRIIGAIIGNRRTVIGISGGGAPERMKRKTVIGDISMTGTVDTINRRRRNGKNTLGRMGMEPRLQSSQKLQKTR